MLKKILLACIFIHLTYSVNANEVINLYSGEVKVLEVSNIQRIAVGNAGIISTSLLNNGQLLLIAEAEGGTNLHIWFKDGSETEYTVRIKSAAGPLQLKMSEVKDLLREVEGMTIREVGNRIVLSGKVDKTFEDAIGTVQGVFPEIMDLTRKLDPTQTDVYELPANKMIYINVKITEFNKNFLENLGILWDTTVAGPAAALALDGATNQKLRATPSPAPSFNSVLNETNGEGNLINNANSAFGYFGIASEITSRINFAVNSGNAVILSEPRLATRSGGEAKFLVGGEFPIEISNINGTTIEFKEYGIKLNVTPEVDKKNYIRASVMTEVSSIDSSVSVNNVPGLRTRRTETAISMNSGDSLVISGLIDQQLSKDVSKVKLLGDIPILGELFKSTNWRRNKSELVIFVTPTVFDVDSDLNKKAIDYADQGVRKAIEKIDPEALDIVY